MPNEDGETGIDGDVPTLPEWGAILLGMLLLGIGYRAQGGWPGRVAGILAVLLLLPLFTPAPAWADEALTYDANGNVQTRTLSGGTTTYGYDALDRVTSEAGPAKTQSLGYDANDNRLSDGSGSKTYSPNSDRLVTENGQSFTLDAAGNVTQARGLNIVWNQRAGQIKTVSQGGTLLATYFYDYQGLRSRKVTTAAAPQGSGTVIYHYDLQGRLIAETTPQGNPIFTYVWRDDVPVSIIVHGVTETALYLETDHLNTPIAARNQAGKVVWRWESEAFGATLPNEDPDGDGQKVTINLRFPGQYFDKESGLHYNWNRYYDPRLGRYMSPDLIGLRGGRNPYAYSFGNPVSYSDPMGLDVLDRIAERSAGIPGAGSAPTPTTVKICRNASLSVGAGLSCTVSWNSCQGTSYVGVGLGFGASASYTYGPNLSAGNPAGLAARVSGALGNGFVGTNGSITPTSTGVAANGGVGVGTIGVSANATIGWKFR